MKYCSSCGHPNQEDANFCIKCGHPFEKEEEWYYANEGRKIGPHTRREMKVLFDKNIIFSTTYVWKKGLSDWICYDQTDLFVQKPVLKDVCKEVPETFEVDEADIDIPLEDIQNEEEGWYYADGIQEIGPFSKAEMIHMFSQKVIDLKTLVRYSNQKEWISLSESKLLPTVRTSKTEKEEKTWYYAINEDSYGPYSKEEMVHSYQVGKITQNMYVWNKGMRDWILFKDSELMPKISLTESHAVQKQNVHSFMTSLKEKGIPKVKELIENIKKKDTKSSVSDESETPVSERSTFESKNILTILIFLFIVCIVAILSFIVFP